MKIALICPANRLYMPYVQSYEQLLKAQQIDYDIINWDRLQLETPSETCYQDGKIGHQRHIIDYVKYKRFILQALQRTQYDRIIVFSIQLTYFLKEILLRSFPQRFIVDIRDHHKLLHFFDIGKWVDSSVWTVLSSARFQNWLPKSNRYLIHHNTPLTNLSNLPHCTPPATQKIRIANIGATRDIAINKSLIRSLGNNIGFEVHYHGAGGCTEELKKYTAKHQIANVLFSGRYEAHQETALYARSDMINILREAKGVNNQTALPNRLYHAAFMAKPLLALAGSYVAELVAEYQLGLVVSSLQEIDQQISHYFKHFSQEQFDEGRVLFLSHVIEENALFRQQVLAFCTEEKVGAMHET